MTPDHFYIQRDGYRETLMAVIGEDEREATSDEQHEHWLTSRDGFDAAAQAADDFATERGQ